MGALALAGMLSNSPQAAARDRQAAVSPLSPAESHFPGRIKRVIHLFMNGGPSQIDTFDPKPLLHKMDGKPLPDSLLNQLQATQKNRAGVLFASPFRFQKRGECGLDVSDLYPHVAQHADDLCVIRSMQG